MSFTTPIYIPLVEGLDLSKDSMLGTKELHAAENVDFSVQGEVRGRPSRASATNVLLRDPASSSGGLLSPQSFEATGLTPRGLMRYKDVTAERALLGTEGRLLAKDDTWRDWGHFACARHDIRASFITNLPASRRKPIAPDFGPSGRGPLATVGNQWFWLLNSDGTAQHEVTAGLPVQVGGPHSGNGAKCGTTTAMVVVNTTNNRLYFIYRANGAATLSLVQLATDAATPADDGDSPSICCDFDQTHFFVCYQTTTANQYKVLRVSTTGTITHTYTGTLAGIHGQWVSNTAASGDRVAVALTNASGLTVKWIRASDMADLAVDSTHATTDGKDVVIGCDSTTSAWWAYRSTDALPALGLHIGTVTNSAASATLKRTYYGGTLAGTRHVAAMHQPILYNGRVYLTVGIALYPNSTDAAVGTWFTLDLSSIATFGYPSLVARGALDGACFGFGVSATPGFQPESATLMDDGWVFASMEWSSYQQIESVGGTFSIGTALKGLTSYNVQNYIRMSGPRAVLAGGATLISGSIPRSVTAGQCFEAGFPSGRPHMATDLDGGAGSSLTGGDYTIYALWVYTDGAGQEHRSNATGATQTAAAGDDIWVFVENPHWTERPNGELKIEVYMSAANAPADDPCYLVSTTTPDWSTGGGRTRVVIDEETDSSARPLYLLEDEFAHFTPNADGGIAAVGRRVWVAGQKAVYASLLIEPGEGVTWNDEGSLQVNLPAGAGRVVALEGLDDKLVIFCEKGVYMTQDGGPDNTGQGPDIAFPVKLSDLGCAGPRSTCTTDRGVVFCSPLDTTDPQRGGPWLLDRSLSLTERRYLGSPAMNFFDASSVPEVAFSPERQQVYVTVPVADTLGNSGVVVIDFRASKWSTWSHNDDTQGEVSSIEVVGGCLWSLGDNPAGFTGAPGTDAEGDYQMLISTGHVHANGTDGLGWSRVRSISVLGQPAGNHDLTIAALQDATRSSQSDTMSITVPGASTTWPSSRHAPEWRLPSQKCSTLGVILLSSNGYARWKAIRLDVQPLPRRAPAGTRN